MVLVHFPVIDCVNWVTRTDFSVHPRFEDYTSMPSPTTKQQSSSSNDSMLLKLSFIPWFCSIARDDVLSVGCAWYVCVAPSSLFSNISRQCSPKIAQMSWRTLFTPSSLPYIVKKWNAASRWRRLSQRECVGYHMWRHVHNCVEVRSLDVYWHVPSAGPILCSGWSSFQNYHLFFVHVLICLASNPRKFVWVANICQRSLTLHRRNASLIFAEKQLDFYRWSRKQRNISPRVATIALACFSQRSLCRHRVIIAFMYPCCRLSEP